MKSKGSLVLDRMLALSTDKQVAAPCGCELFRSGSDGKSVTFRYCELHAQAPALLTALMKARVLVDANNSLSASADGLNERTKNRDKAIAIMDTAIEAAK